MSSLKDLLQGLLLDEQVFLSKGKYHIGLENVNFERRTRLQSKDEQELKQFLEEHSPKAKSYFSQIEQLLKETNLEHASISYAQKLLFEETANPTNLQNVLEALTSRVHENPTNNHLFPQLLMFGHALQSLKSVSTNQSVSDRISTLKKAESLFCVQGSWASVCLHRTRILRARLEREDAQLAILQVELQRTSEDSNLLLVADSLLEICLKLSANDAVCLLWFTRFRDLVSSISDLGNMLLGIAYFRLAHSDLEESPEFLTLGATHLKRVDWQIAQMAWQKTAEPAPGEWWQEILSFATQALIESIAPKQRTPSAIRDKVGPFLEPTLKKLEQYISFAVEEQPQDNAFEVKKKSLLQKLAQKK